METSAGGSALGKPEQTTETAESFTLEDLDSTGLMAIVGAGCPAPWFFDPETSRIHTPDGQPLCGPIAVLGMFRDTEGRGWCRLVAFLDPDGRVQTELVPNRQIEAGRGQQALISALADRGLSMYGPPAMIGALLKSWPTPHRGIVVNHGGWLKLDGVRRGYVFPAGGAITRPGDDAMVLLNGAHPGHRPRTAGTLEVWQKTIGRFAQGNPVMMTMICTALSGPLLDICRLPAVGFNFFARTTTGKTTSVKAALSVFPDYPDIPPTWSGTNTGIELRAARQTDSLLVLDEFPTDPPPHAITIAMALGNGVGAARGTGQLVLRQQTKFRCAIISTAEFPMVQILERAGRTPPPGLSVRLIDLPAKGSHGCFDELHGLGGYEFAKSIDQGARANFGHVAPAFIDRILARSQGDLDRIAARQVAIQGELKAALGLTQCPEIAERVLDSLAVVALAGELGVRADLLPWSRQSVRDAVETMARKWWKHVNRPQELINLLKDIEDLTDMLLPLDVEAAAIIGLDRPLGWSDDTSLYLLPEAITHIDRGSDTPGNRTRIPRMLADAGVLRRGTERRSLQDKITIPGTGRRERVYTLDRAMITSILAEAEATDRGA